MPPRERPRDGVSRIRIQPHETLRAQHRLPGRDDARDASAAGLQVAQVQALLARDGPPLHQAQQTVVVKGPVRVDVGKRVDAQRVHGRVAPRRLDGSVRVGVRSVVAIQVRAPFLHVFARVRVVLGALCHAAIVRVRVRVRRVLALWLLAHFLRSFGVRVLVRFVRALFVGAGDFFDFFKLFKALRFGQQRIQRGVAADRLQKRRAGLQGLARSRGLCELSRRGHVDLI
mmetsp:Transcript_10638/g.35271  ORF Transcript_10638/g.35271 Transcript_10638/m.35271 type:complete len:229 (+) Transcript_10638:515-1201(+)